MGLIGIQPVAESLATVESAPSMYAELGRPVGGIFVAIALVYTLAYLDLVNVADFEDEQLRQIRLLLGAVAFPLFVTFVGIVTLETIKVL